MALVSGRRSTLNPNAPLFIPAAVRQVEDFSPQWWDLVKTATWYRDYWISQHEGGDIFQKGQSVYDEDNVVGLLPDNIDVDVDVEQDILDMEAQYEEFLQSSNIHYGSKAAGGVLQYGFGNNVNAIVKGLYMPKQRGPNSPREPMKHWEKPAKHVSPKHIPYFIHQPR